MTGRISARYLWPVLAAVLLAGCAHPAPPENAAGDVVPARACAVGAGGTRLAEDRGIGGTGIAPAGSTLPVETHDRGIGGTGIRPHETAPAQQMLAKNAVGVVGVITGFGSVCVNGAEIQTAASLPVHGNDGVLDTSALRAGEVVAITADTSGGSPQAEDIALVHEVSGPVEAVRLGGLLIVAGQQVQVIDSTWGLIGPQIGDWVAVSGLRDGDGRIVASRIDPFQPGRVTVHGVLSVAGPHPAIGTLLIQPELPAIALSGQLVVASGVYRNGVLLADAIEPDVLASAPQDFFGDGVSDLSIEGYVSVTAGFVGFGSGLHAARSESFVPNHEAGPSVVTLRRQGAGLLATGAETAPRPGDAPVGFPASLRGVGRGLGGAPQGSGFWPGGSPGSFAPGGASAAPMPNFGMHSPDAPLVGEPGSGGFTPGGRGAGTTPTGQALPFPGQGPNFQGQIPAFPGQTQGASTQAPHVPSGGFPGP